MEINIPESVVTTALEDAAQRALKGLLQGGEVHQALVRAISCTTMADFVVVAVHEAVQAMDNSAVTQVIAREMQRSIAVTVAKIVEDAAVEMIARMRGCYTDTERQQIREEFRHAKEKQ